MRKPVTSVIKRALAKAGHYGRHLSGDRFPGVPVLCYHGIRETSRRPTALRFPKLHVSARTFEEHCQILKRHCQPISLKQWMEAQNHGEPLPPRPVLVTFDDGYRSVVTRALPILAAHSIPAVCFVCDEPIARRSMLWYDAVAQEQGEREADRLSALPHREWEQCYESSVRQVADDHPNALLRREDVLLLASSPGIEVGGHTSRHVRLAGADPETQRGEVQRNKAILESWVGRRLAAFAYPRGMPGEDYTPESVEAVRAAGYQVAFTTICSSARRTPLSFEIPRFVILDSISSAELAHRLCYSWPR